MLENVKAAIERDANPERLADAFIRDYFNEKQITYPINPFQMLTDLGVLFAFREFSRNYEGFYFPPESEEDIPLVGINVKRPIHRQRYTATHELCHFLKDGNNKDSMVCLSGDKSDVEDYAEKFAAALLMPIAELQDQVNFYKVNGYVSFDDVLKISYYFGVSFEACLYRIAYKINGIEGDIASPTLRKRCAEYGPNRKRQELGLEDETVLYEGLFNAIQPWLIIDPSLHTQYKFQNEYVYNDSRLEDIAIEKSEVAEIVADIRIHKQGSKFCASDFKEVIEVAGHAIMYGRVFEKAEKEKISIFDMLLLNGDLYSCAPFPEYGGKFRDTNTLVIGAKFETVDYKDIQQELIQLESEVHKFDNDKEMSLAKYIEGVANLHHRLTVIHPFRDGNGRTTRAFLNIMLIRKKIPPIYFKIENKEEYISALSIADETGNYGALHKVIFKAILRSHSELTETFMH